DRDLDFRLRMQRQICIRERFNQTIKRFFIWLALTVLFAFLSFINYHNGLQITLNFIKNLLNLI
ncbi:hypothetical protein E1N10_13575, partial [Staphylococcus epidermidis]